MKEELTREWVEEALNTARRVSIMTAETVERLATALLEEMDKQKVWDGAPDDATVAEVMFIKNCGDLLENLSYETYTRELPKTRARQIAEEISDGLNRAPRYKNEVDIIESALNKYAEELTNTKETE